MTRVLVTGANGFVGRAVCRRLQSAGCQCVAAVRDETVDIQADEIRYVGDLSGESEMDQQVAGVDAIVHLAARVHVMDERSGDPATAYDRINVEATRRLAEAALRQGIKRFVFLSSIKVNGEETPQAPFSEKDAPNPQDPYGRSKHEAEKCLRDLAALQGLEPVILRVPLVYGPGVKANFLSLLKLCDTAMPLPLGAITENRRSLIFVENLADAIATSVMHSEAAGRTFLVSDGTPVSTASLAVAIRAAFGRPAGLIPVPVGILRMFFSILGKSAAADRLTGSLAVDDRLIRETLGWRPPATFQDGLAATADWYGDMR